LPVNTLARVFMRRKDFYGAQTCYLKAIELDPNWMFPRINLCVLAVENLKNWSLGEQTCRGLLQLDQNKTAGYYFLGRSLEEQGSKCDALRQFRIAIEKASSTTNPGFNVDNLRRRLPKLESQCSL
jgi:tetratricopeptide (TPR) repeat protein